MALIKCPHCGATISDRALQCPKCGVDVKTVQHFTEPTDGGESKNGSTVFVVAVILLIIANVALAIYSFGGRTHGKGDNPMDTLASYDGTDSVAAVNDATVTDAGMMQLKGAVKSVCISTWSDTKQYSFDSGGMLTRYEQTGEGGYVLTETFRNGRIVSSKYEESGDVVTATFSYEQTSEDVTSVWMKSSEFEGRKLYGKDYYYKGRLVCRITFYEGGYLSNAETNITKLNYDVGGNLSYVDCSGGMYNCQPPQGYKVLKKDGYGNWTEANDPSKTDHEMDEMNCNITYYKN